MIGKQRLDRQKKELEKEISVEDMQQIVDANEKLVKERLSMTKILLTSFLLPYDDFITTESTQQ